MKLTLEGKVGLVTGASRGVGKATALAFAEYGADVAINCVKSVDKAEEVAATVREMGRKAVVVRGDVSKEADVKAMVARATEALGPLDIVVNNAGIHSDYWVHNMPLEEWKRIIDNDLTSVFLVCHEVVPSMMERRKGCIINIGSIVAQHFYVPLGLAHYGAAKGGVHAFTRNLAQEVARYGITVNCIAPGTLSTEQTAYRGEEWRRERNKVVPLGRAGTAEEIAMSAVFLASQAGSWYTGQILCPNGGEGMAAQ